jgi:hypothetical protein
MKAGAFSDFVFDFSCLIICIFVAVPDDTHVNISVTTLTQENVAID